MSSSSSAAPTAATRSRVRIGGFSGFWGDAPGAARQLVEHGGELDFLVGDYLAEVTMGILGRQAAAAARKKQEAGFVAEFVDGVWRPLARTLAARRTVVIVNAGGVNARACKRAIEAVNAELGLDSLLVAAIDGDNILDRVAALRDDGALRPFSLEGAAESVDADTPPLLSANAYFGAFPIARALAAGARVVVTGRCVDSALVLGALVHAFGWREGDAAYFDRLAAGSLAGHVLECGCQCTGGNFTDWRSSLRDGARGGGWANMGFPIAECYPDGSFVVTKPPRTGGVVSVASVAEQLLYEIQQPAAYILPDVVADFSHVRLTELPSLAVDDPSFAGRVRVDGARGRAPSTHLKVSATFLSAFKSVATLVVGGDEAPAKARAIADALFTRCARLLREADAPPFDETLAEVLGAEATYGEQNSRRWHDAREVVLRVSARHRDPRVLGRVFAKEVAPFALSSAPGITGDGAGRARPTPLLGQRSALVAKCAITIAVEVGSTRLDDYVHALPADVDAFALDTCLSPFDASNTPPNNDNSNDDDDDDDDDDDKNNAKNNHHHNKNKKNSATATAAAAAAAGASATDADVLVDVPLSLLCHARSGDKGNSVNIGLRVRDFDLGGASDATLRQDVYALLRTPATSPVSARRVHAHMRHVLLGRVGRYELPGIGAFNYVATDALGGGGLTGLGIDRQGKMLGQQLLGMTVRVPRSIAVRARRAIDQQREASERRWRLVDASLTSTSGTSVTQSKL